MEVVGLSVFFVIWFVLFFGSIAAVVCGVAALISISRLHADAFGPWWDNTKTAWLLGIAVSFALPLGSLVTGTYWFWKGRASLRSTGVALRPFWAGPPKPMPPWGPGPYYPQWYPQAPIAPQAHPPAAAYPPPQQEQPPPPN